MASSKPTINALTPGSLREFFSQSRNNPEYWPPHPSCKYELLRSTIATFDQDEFYPTALFFIEQFERCQSDIRATGLMPLRGPATFAAFLLEVNVIASKAAQEAAAAILKKQATESVLDAVNLLALPAIEDASGSHTALDPLLETLADITNTALGYLTYLVGQYAPHQEIPQREHWPDGVLQAAVERAEIFFGLRFDWETAVWRGIQLSPLADQPSLEFGDKADPLIIAASRFRYGRWLLNEAFKATPPSNQPTRIGGDSLSESRLPIAKPLRSTLGPKVVSPTSGLRFRELVQVFCAIQSIINENSWEITSIDSAEFLFPTHEQLSSHIFRHTNFNTEKIDAAIELLLYRPNLKGGIWVRPIVRMGELFIPFVAALHGASVHRFMELKASELQLDRSAAGTFYENMIHDEIKTSLRVAKRLGHHAELLPVKKLRNKKGEFEQIDAAIRLRDHIFILEIKNFPPAADPYEIAELYDKLEEAGRQSRCKVKFVLDNLPHLQESYTTFFSSFAAIEPIVVINSFTACGSLTQGGVPVIDDQALLDFLNNNESKWIIDGFSVKEDRVDQAFFGRESNLGSLFSNFARSPRVVADICLELASRMYKRRGASCEYFVEEFDLLKDSSTW